METMRVKVQGICPLLMHSNRGVNPLDPLVLEKKKFTGKRKKTEEDTLKILDLDYELGIYYDKDIGPYVPAICIEATLREAAKKIKRGVDVKAGVFARPDFIPLIYAGPRDLASLIKDIRFRDVRPGKIGKNSVLICRPRFEKWAIEFDIDFDLFDANEIVNILDIAGKRIGLCDYRPRYGRFYAEVK